MYLVDPAFLTSLRDDADSLLSTVVCEPRQPFFDIAVFGDASLGSSAEADALVEASQKHLEALGGRTAELIVSAGDLIGTPEHEPREDLLQRAGEVLTRVSARGSALLVVAGNRDLAGDKGEYDDFVGRFLRKQATPGTHRKHPVAALFRVMPATDDADEQGLPQIPLAHIVVVGFDSNAADSGSHDYGQIDPTQFDDFRRLVCIMRDKVSRCAPLYVMAVTHHNVLPVEDRTIDPLSADSEAHAKIVENVRNTSANSSGLLERCRRLRVSLLVHAHMHEREVIDLAATPLLPGRVSAQLTLMSAPTMQRGGRASGMGRIRLDLVQGSMELAVDYAQGADGAPGLPVQTSRKLISASRVSVGERRLYAAASRVIAAAEDGNQDAVKSYREHIVRVWEQDGCVPLGLDDGSLPKLVAEERPARYNLLLLLRRRAGRYEILLSRHTPLRPTEVGAWDSLLLPAFKDGRALLDHLYDDVVRLLAAGTTDLAKSSSGREFAAAVKKILQAQPPGESLWAEDLREVAQFTSRKLSPTTGQMTISEYHLVTVLPFVQSARFGASEDEQNTYRTVVNWLNQLPRISLPGEPSTGAGVYPIEALYRNGSGLRWEPSADPDDTAEQIWGKGQPLPPGVVWFPLPEIDERRGAWLDCPMIVHRNRDVMDWVIREIDSRRDARGHYAPHLLLGALSATTGFAVVENGLAPFATDDDSAAATERPARSTVEALRRVKYLANAPDPIDGNPYRNMEIRRVVLLRRSFDRGGTRGAVDVIMVFDATQFSAVADACEVSNDDRLGILRPVQRYVMRAGLDRAQKVNDFRRKLFEEEDHDPWGFVRARLGDFAETLSLTPPIIEQLGMQDTQFDFETPAAHREFVICDGNHRVVHSVWLDRQPSAAVAILGEPLAPYYAYPFSAYEWDNTASQVVNMSPPAEYKYAARKPPADVELIAAERNPQWYRRYFRDLSSGFGNVGAQGGRG